MRRSPPVALLAALLIAALSSSAVAAQSEQIRWKGLLAGRLEFFVTFTPADGGYTATIDIPAQGLSGGELTDVVHTDEEIAFRLPIAPPSGAVFKATREAGGTTASGTIEQGGRQFPITMEIMEEGAAAGPSPRPQTPAPPFPYTEREASYSNPADGTQLAGTLTIPQGDGPFPATLLITGSGAQNRDEEILGHKPFLVIADHLTRNGIVVLRVDDRGVGGSTGDVATSTSQDFAGDVLAGVAFLARQPEIDANQIGLIGHSEGGIVAPIAASRSDAVAFIVLLAGTGISGAELMAMQLAGIQRSIGRPEDNIELQMAAQRKVFDAVLSGAGRGAVRAAVAELTTIQVAALPAAQRPSEAELQPAIDAETDQILGAWWQFFLSYDPGDALREVTCPVLALNGSLDLQVPSGPNLEAIRAALVEAGNRDVTIEELEGLNHLFQSATTGSPAEYAVIDRITRWIHGHTVRRPIAELLLKAA